MGSPIETDVEVVLARLDRTSSETLLSSIASELVRLHQFYVMLLSRVVVMESLQTTIDRIAADTPGTLAIDLPTSLEIDAAFSLSRVQGFYELEYGDRGRPYRWTGPDPQFSFDLFVKRENPLLFILKFVRLFADTSPIGMRCYVDGRETPVKLTRISEGFHLQGVLPPRPEPGGSVLSFICPAMQSPLEAKLSSDQRRLGIAFERLIVDPAPLSGDELVTQAASMVMAVPGSAEPSAAVPENAAARGSKTPPGEDVASPFQPDVGASPLDD